MEAHFIRFPRLLQHSATLFEAELLLPLETFKIIALTVDRGQKLCDILLKSVALKSLSSSVQRATLLLYGDSMAICLIYT